MTMSGGVALYPDDGSHWDSLFAAADRRLYAAKRAGRDRVEANG
jgi:GGDEF domain-containing protein